MTSGPAASAPLVALLELQTIDSRADQLRYQIEHHEARVALEQLAQRHRALGSRRGPLADAVAAFDRRQGELEREIEEGDKRIGVIDARLRAGGAGSYRDEAAMSEEIASLKRRKSHIEEQVLEVMEEREPADNELEALTAEEAEIEAEARVRQSELTEARRELTEELGVIEGRRAEIAAGVGATLLAEYERLRARLAGVGVAEVAHGTCTGCNLALSATEVDRIAHGAPGSFTHCEQCGRLLVARA